MIEFGLMLILQQLILKELESFRIKDLSVRKGKKK